MNTESLSEELEQELEVSSQDGEYCSKGVDRSKYWRGGEEGRRGGGGGGREGGGGEEGRRGEERRGDLHVRTMVRPHAESGYLALRVYRSEERPVGQDVQSRWREDA